jgi:predicted metalloprotease with PDZ domain
MRNAPPTTTEIPPVLQLQAQDGAPAAAPDSHDQSADLYNYQSQQTPAEMQQQLQSLQEFLEEGDNATTIGMVVREGHRKVDDGGEVAGLLIVSVMAGSPAADAGLKGVRTGTHVMLEGAAVAASLFFPPAIMAVALVDSTRVGESYDMIIAVDSVRVTNFLDFNDRMRQVQPGDIIYLGVIRNGKRMQVQVKVPGTPASASPPSGTTASAAASGAGSTATTVRTP